MAKTKTRKSTVGDKEVTIDRRRAPKDRRKTSAEKPVIEERRKPERKKVPRRRQIDPTTCERDYSNDEIEFMHALDEYKRVNGRMFPTCSEVLEVIRALGYRRLTPDELAKIGPLLGDASEGEMGGDSISVLELDAEDEGAWDDAHEFA